MQNIVISRSDTTRLRVAKFEEFRRFELKRMEIRIGIFPSNDIAAMENSENAMKSSSPLVKVQSIAKHTMGALELLAADLVVEFVMMVVRLKVSGLQATDPCGLILEYRYATI